MEIHTPKIISAASEGGANVFKVSFLIIILYLLPQGRSFSRIPQYATGKYISSLGLGGKDMSTLD